MKKNRAIKLQEEVTEEFANDSGFRSDKKDVEPAATNLAPGETPPEENVNKDPEPNNTDNDPAPADTTTTGGQPEIKLDAESLAALKAAAEPAPSPEPEPQITAEQINTLTKAHVVDAEEVAFFMGKDVEDVTEEEINRLQAHTNSIRDNAIAVADLSSKVQMQEILKLVEPLVQQQQTNERQSTFDRFYGEYPGLKQFEPLVKQVAGTIKDFKGTEAEAFKMVADTVVAQGKQMSVEIDPTKKLSNETTNQVTPDKEVPNMVTTAAGGRSQTSGEDTSVGEGHVFKSPWSGKPYNPNPNNPQ